MTIWASIGTAIWNQMQPWLDAKWEEVKPKVFQIIREQFEEWMPKVLKTVLVGTAQATAHIAVEGADRVTDAIPGQLDDDILDPIVEQGVQKLRDLFGLNI